MYPFGSTVFGLRAKPALLSSPSETALLVFPTAPFPRQLGIKQGLNNLFLSCLRPAEAQTVLVNIWDVCIGILGHKDETKSKHRTHICSNVAPHRMEMILHDFLKM